MPKIKLLDWSKLKPATPEKNRYVIELRKTKRPKYNEQRNQRS